MFRKLLVTLSSTISGGALIIGLASIASRGIGLVRDNILAKYFGASATLDIYNAAFKIPDFIFNIVVLGALSASFIPMFLEVKQKKGEEGAFRLASSVLTLLLVVVTVSVIFGILFAPQLASWLMAERSVVDQKLTADTMRLMLVSVIFFTVSNVASGMLNSYRRFAAYALAPIMYNVGIIIGIIWLSPSMGVYGLALGVVLGAAMHALIQMPSLFALGYRYVPSFNWRDADVVKLLQLMPPRALALGLTQVNAALITYFALRLEAGSLTIWTWADNLQHFPINVFGVSLALSSFPVFSQAYAEQDFAKFKESFSQNFRRIMFLIIPISVIVLLLRAQFVRLVLGSFGGGQFDWTATIATAQVLGVFAISMFAQASVPILARAFFARHDTKTPVIVSIVNVALNAVLAWKLSEIYGLIGLAMAFTISSLVAMLALLTILRIEFGDLDDRQIIQSVWKITGLTLVMGTVIQGMKYTVASVVDMQTFLGIFMQTSVSVATGIAVYCALALWLNVAEVAIVREYVQKMVRSVRKAIGKTA